VAVSLLPPDRIFSLDTVRLFARRIQQTDQMYALYYGSVRGNVVLVFNLAAGPDEGGARYLGWVIERPTPNEFVQTVFRLDDKLEVLDADERQNNGYDPRTRPWFHSAFAANGAIQIPPYVYFRSRDLGTTVAIKTPSGEGVVGGDLMLRTLSEALRTRRYADSSHAVIFDASTRILGAADVEHVLSIQRPEDRPIIEQRTLASIDLPAYRGLERLFSSGVSTGAHEVEIDGDNWVIWLSPITVGPRQDAIMSIMAPSDIVFASVIERGRTSILIAIVGIGFGLLIASLIASRVSRPIRILTGEAHRLREFEFGDLAPIKSRIREVHQLAEAVETLKRSLRDFACYVPSQIVRRLLAGEMSAEIGGERNQVTLMFSDVEGFTSMSEQMTPMELLRDTSEYFSEVTQVLRSGGGTIDRFIGDAIMAMWNAPVRQPDHVMLACASVLGAAEAVDLFNKKRIEAGKRPFVTRFGLHVGDAVVGNVGSAENMTYTAVGANVNLASRLEGLNKVFGTNILISENVNEAISGTFLTRPLDTVRPLGASRPMRVYELFEDSRFEGDEAATQAFLDSWTACYAHYSARRWDATVGALDVHCTIYPGDTAAEALRGRAKEYLNDPPPDDWDGVFDALSK
jgi:adenylate cyclase